MNTQDIHSPFLFLASLAGNICSIGDDMPDAGGDDPAPSDDTGGDQDPDLAAEQASLASEGQDDQEPPEEDQATAPAAEAPATPDGADPLDALDLGLPPAPAPQQAQAPAPPADPAMAKMLEEMASNTRFQRQVMENELAQRAEQQRVAAVQATKPKAPPPDATESELHTHRLETRIWEQDQKLAAIMAPVQELNKIAKEQAQLAQRQQQEVQRQQIVQQQQQVLQNTFAKVSQVPGYEAFKQPVVQDVFSIIYQRACAEQGGQAVDPRQLAREFNEMLRVAANPLPTARAAARTTQAAAQDARRAAARCVPPRTGTAKPQAKLRNDSPGTLSRHERLLQRGAAALEELGLN